MPDSPVDRLKPHWPEAPGRHYRPTYEPRTLGELAKPMEKRFEEFMGEHPKLTVAAAAGLGLLLGWMIKRK
jgi:ElaB/YqjD/DUF883 family membrane-anchored ribosome-binding protein